MTRLTKTLFVVVLLLLITQTLAIFYFYDMLNSMRLELNSTRSGLQENINLNYLQTQNQIDQLRSNLLSTQEDFSSQINQLKASASADFSGIIEEAVKSVVSIKTDVAQGSGFIITSDGYIVTNAHVLQGAHYAKALTSDNELIDAEPIGLDPSADVALLKIFGSYKALDFGDSDDVRVGEKVIAVGNPYGLSFTVTEGIVSAVKRKGMNNIEAYIQTDVALNPGNSGGPLIDINGEVIGINNFKVSGGESLGFALESNYAKAVINNIAEQLLNKNIV